MSTDDLLRRIAAAPMPATSLEALRQLADVALLWVLKARDAVFHVKHGE